MGSRWLDSPKCLHLNVGTWRAQLGWWLGAFLLLHSFKFSQGQSTEAWRGPHWQRECSDQPQVKRLSLKPFVCSEKGRIVGDHIWRQFPQEDELGKDINFGHCVALNDVGDEVFIPFVTVAISGIGSTPAVMKMFYRDLWPSFDCQAIETMFL